MTKKLRWMVTILCCVLLQGCFCVGCFVPQLPPPPEPYVTHWEKPGMTEESRLQDWVACGGFENGSVGVVLQDRLPGESQSDSQNRQAAKFQRCMIRAGYHYTGNCEHPYMKAQPLCGAP